MRKYTDQEIIEKAFLKASSLPEGTQDFADITVDFDDETGTTHSYVVTFKRATEKGVPTWIPSEINEISSL